MERREDTGWQKDVLTSYQTGPVCLCSPARCRRAARAQSPARTTRYVSRCADRPERPERSNLAMPCRLLLLPDCWHVSRSDQLAVNIRAYMQQRMSASCWVGLRENEDILSTGLDGLWAR